MNNLVMHTFLAPSARSLAMAFLLFLAAFPAYAAKLEWSKADGRERISISMNEKDGMAGQVARIAPTGVLIPFTEVPEGLVVTTPPKDASIFKGSKQLGRSLVLETQTEAFGFVVTKQSSTELVVDFFPNALGTRWKPTAKAPTTEMAPDVGIREPSAPTAATKALEADPQGQGPVTAALLAIEKNTPQTSAQGGPLPARNGSGAPAPLPPGNGMPGMPGASAPAAEQPAVPVLPGSPLHAATATKMAEPPAGPPTGAKPDVPGVQPQAEPAQAQEKRAPEASPQTAPSFPMLDARLQNAERAAPLPLPEPPAAGAQHAAPAVSTPEAVPAQKTPANKNASTTLHPEAMPAQPGDAPLAAPPPVSASAPGMAQAGTDAPAARTPAGDSSPVKPATQAAQPAQDPPARTKAGSGPVFRASLDPDAQPIGEQSAASATVVSGHISPEDLSAPATAATPEGEEAPARQQEAAAPETAEAAPEAVPVDAEGNPIPPPPDPALIIPELHNLFASGQYPPALELADLLLEHGELSPEQREDVLHTRAELLFAINKDALDQHFTEIADATNQAISFNQQSRRNAGAYLRLGYMNLKLKNIPEARAHFNLLRRLYPDDENVPLSYYYWGDYYFNKDELQKAADEFQYILQKFPNSRYAREAALGLARAFYRMGYYEQSFNVVDYIEKRWERFYIEYPPFLNMMGDVAFRLDKLEYALKQYWLYINLMPSGEEADIILTRIGDIYTKMREKSAAIQLYRASMDRFPDKDGGMVAMMRLAEESVNDDPTVAGMFSVFDGGHSLAPAEIYRSIIEKHPESALVPLAKLKLALWHLWNKDYLETLDIVEGFLKDYPKHELAPKAREVAMQTFAVLSAESIVDERYGRMRDIWERYPVVHEQANLLSPETRIALGVSYRQDGKPNEALAIVDPFFLGRKTPEGEMALSLVLSIYLEHEQWESVRAVGQRVELWELTPESKRMLDYSLALAAEQLGESDVAAPIWQTLYDSGKLPAAQMAYASFFLARNAERQRELEKAYLLGREALNRLISQVERTPSAADVGKIQTQLASLMDVTETAGRLREALGFAEQYLQYLSEDSPERIGVRYRMARIYKKQGDQNAWKAALQEIAAQAPDSVYGQLAGSELKAASLAEDAAQYSPTGRL